MEPIFGPESEKFLRRHPRPTLGDWAKRLDPEGKVPAIVELLAQSNEILTDMRWIEGNVPSTGRTGLPMVAWRLLNEGVKPTTQAGMLEAWSEGGTDVGIKLTMSGRTISARTFDEMCAIVSFMETILGDSNALWKDKLQRVSAELEARTNERDMLICRIHDLERLRAAYRRRRKVKR